jgi:NitT/TauT family transport system substrate-binding protein
MNSSSERPDETLRIYGNLSLLEMAPVLLATRIYPGKTRLEHGSVMSLWEESSDLASLDSAGRSDIALNSETQALRASVVHPDLRFIFTVAECPYRIVARRSAGITTLAELRGKRVGTQLESSAAYFLESMLQTVGLEQRDVICVPFMAHTQRPISLLPQALRSGELDAVALWEPQVQRARLALGEDAVEFRNPAVYTEKFNLCTAEANLADSRLRPRIVAFCRALSEAARRLKQEPSLGYELVADAANLDIETVSSAWPYLTYPGTLASDLLDVFEKQEVWIAKLQGRSPRSRGELSMLIDHSVLREAEAIAP